MGKVDWSEKHFLISRTDSIGDVVLTLPMTAWLKNQYPNCRITFLCRAYTAPIVSKYKAVDQVLILDDFTSKSEKDQVALFKNGAYDCIIHVFPNKAIARLAKKASIPYRIGTSHRTFHWLTCNIRQNFTRKNSPLHEAQLNFELVRPLGLTKIPTWAEINEATQAFVVEQTSLPERLIPFTTEPIICLHPKSQGSAKEWPMSNYIALANILLENNKVVCFTGTENEGQLFRDQIPKHERCFDTTGQLSIDQLCWLITISEGLVACSTGPLHIAGILGKQAIGLFSPKKPIHPGRWRPLGNKSTTLVYDENCVTCQANKPCNCIEQITPETVLAVICKENEPAR
jgi:ADP-heptose:LPS heptosyltransferase